MSVPDPAAPRKPRRLALYAPFVLALVLAIAWSGYWWMARSRTAQGLEDNAEAMREAGYEVAWESAKVGGYPFRVSVVLTGARVRDPSGWGLAAPRLEAESFLHGLGHWVMAAPQGLTVERPEGGAVNVTGKLLRASLGKLDKRPPSFSFEGADVAFAPAPGARPFSLSAAKKLELHLRPGPDDQGAVMFRVDDGRGGSASVLGRIAGEKPVTLLWDSTLSKMSAFEGASWTSAARAWSQGGGTIVLRQAGVTAGDAALNVQSGSLAAGGDGRLRGDLAIELRGAPLVASAAVQSGLLPPETAETAAAVLGARQGSGEAARADLVFQAGRVTIGPVALGPAPRHY